MPRYRRAPVADIDLAELHEYVDNEFEKLEEAIEFATDIQLTELHVEPAKRREGMIVFADGTDWDPGSGAGFYGYRGGTWQLLG